jgi:uncharacterized protein with PIN domain
VTAAPLEIGPVPMLADRMLGKLARLLRMVGHDVEYAREGDPIEIGRRAAREGRVLLTRDKRLAMRKDAGRTLFVENNYPFHQARQVLRTLSLGIDSGFTRCVEDNGRLIEVELAAVVDRVPEHVRAEVHALWRCDRCTRVFWDGTHVAAMRETIAALETGPLVPGDGSTDEQEASALRTLEPLVDLHQAFDVILLQHRIALMDADLPRATRMLRRFAMCMRRHVSDENELVLPVYAGAAPASGYERGAAPAIFEHDHDKILGHLDELEASIEALARTSQDEDLKARCLQLLDREKVFTDLLEHHDTRERTFLYPALERMLAEEEKQDLIERMIGIVSKE